MKTMFRTRVLVLLVGPLLALAQPARGDTISDARRCDYAWVDRLDFTIDAPIGGGARSRSDECGLIGKPAGDLSLILNLRDFGLPADARLRLAGVVQPAGFVRWTVDPASVPRRVAGYDIRSLTGSIDTDVRAIGPFEADCGGVLRTFRVRLDLRPNGGTGTANLNRLVLDAGLITGPVRVFVTAFGAELATPVRAPLTLADLRLAASSVRAVAGVDTRVNGTVSVTADPDGRTYDVTLAARGTPANSRIRVAPDAPRFTGTTRSQAFTMTAPARYVGTVEVTATGSDGAVRRATVRITEPGVQFDRVDIIPEKRFLVDPLWDPTPDVLRQAQPIRRKPVDPALKAPQEKAAIPVPQPPFPRKAMPQPPEKREPRQVLPPVKGKE